MNKEKLFELYQKLYFHEMGVREKITGRVQVTFALVATGYAISSYMLRMLDYTIANQMTVGIFFVLLFLSLGLSFWCLQYLLKAFWGNTYKGIPTSKDIDAYQKSLITHKKDTENYNYNHPNNVQTIVDVELRLSDYMYDKYAECSSHNTDLNDQRSIQIHLAFKWLLISSIPLFIASIFFVAFDLDASSPRKETAIIDSSVAKELSEIKNGLKKYSIAKELLDIKISIDKQSTVQELSDIKIALDKLLLNTKELIIMSETEDKYVPEPLPAPEEPSTRPLVENDTPKPTY
jgi:hypothetical protein